MVQGDKEKECCLTVSPLMDRTLQGLLHCQGPHSAYSFEAKYMDHTYSQMYMVVRFSIPVLQHLTGSP